MYEYDTLIRSTRLLVSLRKVARKATRPFSVGRVCNRNNVPFHNAVEADAGGDVENVLPTGWLTSVAERLWTAPSSEATLPNEDELMPTDNVLHPWATVG